MLLFTASAVLGGTQTVSVGEQGADENISNEEG
jgi:hypothetical protein